jgi:hypothetical protein
MDTIMNDHRDNRQANAAWGLCGSCLHLRLVRTDRESVFVRCARSAEDPAFPRYPRLPVRQCRGYVATASDSTGAPGASAAREPTDN